MTDTGKPPALTDRQGMGGVIAQAGFDYQLWDGLVRLPAWLANPAFEELIFEGLEDLEARFFAPHAPRQRLLERYQAKSGDLTPAQLGDVLRSFQRFESSFPRAARIQTLVTPRLPKTFSWLGGDAIRVRRARPFYAPFHDVMEASDATLRARLVEAFGESLGPFVAQAVEISERNLPDLDSAVQSFGTALQRAFPSVEPSPRRVSDSFDALSNLARHSMGVPLTRWSLIDVLEEKLGERLPLPKSFPIKIRSDRNDSDDAHLEIDASAFSNSNGEFPAAQRWRDELLSPLDHTGRWLRANGVTRVMLGGSYRLTTAMAVGWSLRAATGFELEIPTRVGMWATDDRPDADDSPAAWQLAEPNALHGDQLVVCIGILRSPIAELPQAAGIPTTAALSAYLPEPLTSARAAQVGVSVVKRAVDVATARLRPNSIRLFIAGPAAFFVALGHRWNAMPPTQLHEFLPSERRYVPTARL